MTPADLSCPSCGCPVAVPDDLLETSTPQAGPAAPLAPLSPPGGGLDLLPAGELCQADAATGTYCEKHSRHLITCAALRHPLDRGAA